MSSHTRGKSRSSALIVHCCSRPRATATVTSCENTDERLLSQAPDKRTIQKVQVNAPSFVYFVSAERKQSGSRFVGHRSDECHCDVAPWHMSHLKTTALTTCSSIGNQHCFVHLHISARMISAGSHVLTDRVHSSLFPLFHSWCR